MDSMLKGIFGGQDNDNDDRYQSQAQDFVGRYEQGAPWTNFSGDEAYERYQQVAQHAPPEVYQQSAEQAFSRMDPSQRAEIAQMLQQQRGQGGGYNDDPRELARYATQYQQQNPGGLGGLFGGGGGAGGGLGGMLGSVVGGGQQRSGGSGMGEMLNNPMAKAALGGIAAMAIKQMMNKR